MDVIKNLDNIEYKLEKKSMSEGQINNPYADLNDKLYAIRN